jgi:hypothetical protein
MGRKADKKPTLIESFDFCRPRRTLDCEDSALEIFFQHFELHKLYQQRAVISNSLRRLIEVAHCYHPMLWLVGVTSAQINEEKLDQVEELDAHMHVALVPKAMFAQWCLRGRSLTNQAETMPNGGAEWGDDQRSLERSARSRGVMVIEGTGFLEPTGENATLDLQSALYHLLGTEAGPAFELARKVYGYSRGAPSGFYKVVVGMYTAAFLQRGGTACGFVPCYADDLSRYAVRFQDVTADRERKNIAVRMLPPASRAVLAEVERVSVDLYPVGPLEHANLRDYDNDSDVLQTARRNVALCLTALNKLARRITSNTAVVPMRTSLVYYLKYEACTLEALSALVGAVQRVLASRVCHMVQLNGTQQAEVEFTLESVGITEERVAHDFGMFRVALQVAVPLVSSSTARN